MKTLLECRNELDEIDNQILKLFEQRMDIVKDVAIYKSENNLPICDAKREKLMLEKNVEKCENSEYKKYYEIVLNGFLTASKQLQNDLKTNKK